ncbi:hypothetical protein FHS27_004785 [Rhodopirellula rubra]|uniref:Membrane protein containing DUF1550 n=1 Tax=Aporhodopirellula rubra TaxID=980271 RepID=A0A7W5E2G4_9BACT|nr:BatA domain-containing protein [Aporhodopirellula rubra]MBB3208951.1 hypothetical protein [Aporhodopirellula rubra]
MTFVNAVMALGAVAFVVPLAIHLLFRSRYRTMDWGAMFLLQDVVRANRRRMQWHQWILLALRCAIPILLALAMARPLISSVQSMAGKQPVSLVLMIDDSRSMSAGARSTRAIEGVLDLLDSMSRGDEVIVMPTSQLSAPVSIGSVIDAKSLVKELRFDASAMDLTATLQSAVAACRRATNPYCRIVVVSDFQENVLAVNESASMLAVIDSIGERLDQFDPRPQLDFLDVSASDEDANVMANVLVESIEADVPAVMAGHDVPIVATIRNDSDRPVTNLRANWLVDGRVFETETVEIQPRGTVSLNWRVRFDTPGGVSVGLAIEHTDAIPADNRRLHAIKVQRPIRVWLVDGEPSSEPLQSETDFLKVALSPFAFRSAEVGNRMPTRSPRQRSSERFDDATQRDVVSTKVMTSKSFVKELANVMGNDDNAGEDHPDLIVFANVARPPQMSAQKSGNPNSESDDLVTRYLTTGGHVMFFDGDLVDGAAWNESGWLPGKLEEMVDAEGGPFRIESPGARVAVWEELGSDEESLFDSVEILRRRSLTIDSKSTSVLLKSQAGEPLVTTRRIERPDITGSIGGDATGGKPNAVIDESNSQVPGGHRGGRVVQFALPCDTAWSNLPLRPVFLPMVQQLVLEMAGGDEQANVLPGTAMVIYPDRHIGGGKDDQVWQVIRPDGASQTYVTSGGNPLVYGDTHRVGAYRFGPAEDGLGPDERALNAEDVSADEERSSGELDPSVQVRVVEVPASESVLRRASPEILAECDQRLRANRYGDAEGLVAAAQRERFGTEIWRPLLWALLAVMIGEVLWQQLKVTKPANRFAGAGTGVAS